MVAGSLTRFIFEFALHEGLAPARRRHLRRDLRRGPVRVRRLQEVHQLGRARRRPERRRLHEDDAATGQQEVVPPAASSTTGPASTRCSRRPSASSPSSSASSPCPTRTTRGSLLIPTPVTPKRLRHPRTRRRRWRESPRRPSRWRIPKCSPHAAFACFPWRRARAKRGFRRFRLRIRGGVVLMGNV